MSIKILKKNDKNILKLKKAENGVEYFSFEALEKYTELINGFSTRIGGVSEGPYASMNLSFSRQFCALISGAFHQCKSSG